MTAIQHFFKVETPEDVDILVIRPRHDGEWEVTLTLPRAWGPYTTATGRGASPLAASRSASETILPLRDAARERRALQETALREARERSASARAALPDTSGRPAPRPKPAGSPGSFGPTRTRSPDAVTGWADSVPRQAAQWHVAADRTVMVVLWPDLEFSPDAPGTADGPRIRHFATVRQAKDWTRAALDAPVRTRNPSAEQQVLRPRPGDDQRDLFGGTP